LSWGFQIKVPQLYFADSEDVKTLYETQGINILNPEEPEQEAEKDKPPNKDGEAKTPTIILNAMKARGKKLPNCPLDKTRFFFVKPNKSKRTTFAECFKKNLEFWKELLNSEEFKGMQGDNHYTQHHELKRPIVLSIQSFEPVQACTLYFRPSCARGPTT